jgi:hypothetical protein
VRFRAPLPLSSLRDRRRLFSISLLLRFKRILLFQRQNMKIFFGCRFLRFGQCFLAFVKDKSYFNTKNVKTLRTEPVCSLDSTKKVGDYKKSFETRPPKRECG